MISAALTATLLLAVAAGGDDARALIQKAIEAHGGRALLEAPPTHILRGDATSIFRSREFPGSGTVYIEGDKLRSERTFTMRGRERDFIQTWDGSEAWSESFGRRSERPPEPSSVEVAHRPERALLTALTADVELSDQGDDGNVVIELTIGAGPAKIGFDAESGFVAFVEYSYPHQSGLDETEMKIRRDTYDRWDLSSDGFAIARARSTSLDGVESSRFDVESYEIVEDIDDELFRLELDPKPPVASDELAN